MRNLPHLTKLCLAVSVVLLPLQADCARPGHAPVRQEDKSQAGGAKISDLRAEIKALRAELEKIHSTVDARLQRLEQQLNVPASGQTPVAQPASVPPATAELPKPAKAGGVISVCSQGCDFKDLQDAVTAAPAKGKIEVAAEINGTCAVINKPLHLLGKRGPAGVRAHLAGGVCEGKGPLVIGAADVVIEGFEISGVNVGDGNGACIRLNPGVRNLTVRDINCHDSQDGILGKSEGKFLIENSVFTANGFGDGQAHGLYIEGDEVFISHSQILSTKNSGHSLKSGARKLTVTDSIIAALNGHNSRAIDAYSGGEITLLRNIIQQGPESENSDIIGLGMEAARLQPANHKLIMQDNWVIYDGSASAVLLRGRQLGPIEIRNNTFVGFKELGFSDVTDSGNRWFKTRDNAGLPAFDGSAASLKPRS